MGDDDEEYARFFRRGIYVTASFFGSFMLIAWLRCHVAITFTY